MTPRQFEHDQSGSVGAAGDRDTSPSESFTDDTAIIEGSEERPNQGLGGKQRPVEVGAAVYSADGEHVAVVEIVNADGIGIRAGSPGRSIIVPASGLARVSPDGRRVDLYASAQEIRDLSGANESGASHLAAQQPQTLAHDDQARAPATGNGGIIGPVEHPADGADVR